MITLNKLSTEDIDQKIRLNQEAGIDIFQLRDLIKEEYKDFIWMKIRADIQCQFYLEQLEHIEKRIKEGRVYHEPPPEVGASVMASAEPTGEVVTREPSLTENLKVSEVRI